MRNNIYSHPGARNISSFVFVAHNFWGDRDYSTSWKLNQLFILKSREHYENWFWKEYLCKSWDVYINTLDFNLYLYRRISATLDVIFAVIKLIAFIAMRIHVALTECYDMHAKFFFLKLQVKNNRMCFNTHIACIKLLTHFTFWKKIVNIILCSTGLAFFKVIV